MGCPGLGINSWCSVKKEVTYGTNPGSPTSFLKLIDESLNCDLSFQQLPAASQTDVRMYKGNKRVQGDLQPEFHYEDAGLILQAGLGGVTTTGPTDTAAFDHKFTFEDTLPSLSIQVSKGNIPSDKVFLYTGCKVDQLRLEWTGEDVLRLRASLVCQNEAPNTAKEGTVSYATLPVYNYHLDTTFTTLCGVSMPRVKSGSIIVNNALSKERFFVGNELIEEPCRDGKRIVEGTLLLEFEDLSAYTAYTTPTQGSLALKWDSNIIIPDCASTTYKIQIALAGVYIKGETPKVTSAGIIELPLSFQMSTTPGAGTCYINLTNGETTIT